MLSQLLDLTLIQLSNWRWAWRGTLLAGIVTPLLSLIALGIFARDSGPQALSYVLTGNVVLALMFENLGRVASNFAFMKAMGTLDYFATLPIRRYLLVVATLIAFFILSLPATITTILAGTLVLAGTRARLPEEAGSISLLLVLLLTGMGPVIIPPDRLPVWLVYLGTLSPATYAASALRQTLLGPLTPRLFLDLTVLLLVTIVVSVLVHRTMRWR